MAAPIDGTTTAPGTRCVSTSILSADHVESWAPLCLPFTLPRRRSVPLSRCSCDMREVERMQPMRGQTTTVSMAPPKSRVVSW
jgi:hypothetical protein